jgi:hypothetical protein
MEQAYVVAQIKRRFDLKPSTIPVIRSRVTSWSVATILLAFAVLVAGCSVSSQLDSAKSSPQAKVADGTTVASRYLAIAVAGNSRLETDFDQLSGRDRDRLRNALADLSDASATERLFDRRLLMIAFPPALKIIAEALYTANQSRAELTAEAAMSRTLGQLSGYEPRLSAANVPVEREVRLIRSSLHLPPPMTS